MEAEGSHYPCAGAPLAGSLTNPHGIRPTRVLGSPPRIGHRHGQPRSPGASSASNGGPICSSPTSALEIPSPAHSEAESSVPQAAGVISSRQLWFLREFTVV